MSKSFIVQSTNQWGSILQGQRKSLGLTQKELGDKVGLTQQVISRLEHNPAGTSLQTILKVVAGLDLEISLSQREKTNGKARW